MTQRFHSFLELLLVLAILAIGAYAYLHPAAASQLVSRLGVTSAHRSDRVASPAPTTTVEVSSRAESVPSWGTRIAAGHAFAKHGREFGFSRRSELAAHIDRVIASPSASRQLSHGRQAYWDDGTGTVVICDPSTPDGGTAFKPDRGRRYYEGLR